MATAIDFAAMMAEEKRKMLLGTTAKPVGESAAQPKNVPGKAPLEGGLPWQDCTDRPVNLAFGRRAKVDLAQYEAVGDELKVATHSKRQLSYRGKVYERCRFG